jgi:serine/threonine protein kinase
MGNISSVHGHYQVQENIAYHVEKTGFVRSDIAAPEEGTFGQVRRCVDLKTHEARAVKTIPKTTSERRRLVLNEIEMLKAVSGKQENVVRYVEYFEQRSHFDIIFEWCDSGTLEKLAKSGSVSMKSAAFYFVQLLDALGFLKKSGVLHRDIKPSNVLLASGLGEHYACKLSDFGCACKHEASKKIQEPHGTPAYVAPEVLILPKGDGYSFPADMWGAGIILYVMLFKGHHPFQNGADVDPQLARTSSYQLGWMNVWSPGAASLITWLLLPYPAQRIELEKAANHPWLGSYGYGSASFKDPPPKKRFVPDRNGHWGPESSTTCGVF